MQEQVVAVDAVEGEGGVVGQPLAAMTGEAAVRDRRQHGLETAAWTNDLVVRAEEARETMRDLDRRLQALERDVTSSGTRLAREIDSLR